MNNLDHTAIYLLDNHAIRIILNFAIKRDQIALTIKIWIQSFLPIVLPIMEKIAYIIMEYDALTNIVSKILIKIGIKINIARHKTERNITINWRMVIKYQISWLFFKLLM